jgi:choloylglycine hydrolase
MNQTRMPWGSLLATALLLSMPLSRAHACTDVLVKTDHDQVVSGRNMDYPKVFDSKILIVPAGQKFQSKADPGLVGLSWVSRYGYVGVTGGTSWIADGMNEKGLTIAKQTLAMTQFPDPAKGKPNLEMKLFCDWVLGTCSSIEEVAKALPAINPFNTSKHDPVHFALHDQGGHSAVIEFIQGEPKFSPNPNGILTNGPSLAWQETNLKYFRWKRTMHDASVAIPEGYFSVERFLRATVMRDALPAAGTPQGAVANALSILASVAPPYGMPGTYTPEAKYGETLKYDFTQWTVVRDQYNLVYYYKSVDNPGLKAINLKTLDLSGKTEYSPIPVRNGDWSVPAPLMPVTAHQ